MTCRIPFLAAPLFALLLVGGCVSFQKTDTKRSSIEQLLLSTAADRAACEIAAHPLSGKKVFLDTAGLEAVDKGYAVGTIREKLGAKGVQFVAEVKEADAIAEAVCGGLGTDSEESLIGIPAFQIPTPTGSVGTPELALFKSTKQRGMAKFLLYARDAKTGRHILTTGPHLGQAYFNRYVILVVKFRTTDIPGKP